MPITYTLNTDLERLAKIRLDSLSLKSKANGDYVLQLFNWQKRYIPSQPRKFSSSSHLVVPTELSQGYKNLKEAIQKGENINGYLSSNLNDANYADGFLNHFGLYHFHLGVGLETSGKSNGYIKRTRDIALAKVTDEEVIIILIEDHNHHSNPDIWFDPKYIQILHDEFPESIKKFKINGMIVSNPITTADDFRKLRKVNLNVSVTTADGTSYMTPGGGVSASGHSTEAVMQMLSLKRRIHCLEKNIFSSLIDFIPNQLGKCTLNLIDLDNNLSLFEVKYNVFKKALLIIDEQENKLRLLSFNGIYSINISSFHKVKEVIFIKFSDGSNSAKEYILSTHKNYTSLFHLRNKVAQEIFSIEKKLNENFKLNILTKDIGIIIYP
ncbi:hypothetical protein [Acinetobacter lwoffii]|uniref:Uncharacterized protein n=3 Tax=Acinetobacter lwoffii TaxID=28090 RepID=A0AAW8ATF3_ACILW|nr:hypothetical protein [Acinetobacter lwoffii]ENW32161.1 hypothetical protein F924_00117 [Acinetobacter lwoffii ATCC 9957 = CIP 70.31]MDP1448681.1 hypothetical protein [Acinetobacter lwoffii]